MGTTLKLVAKKDKTVLASENVYDTETDSEEAKKRVWKRMMRQLKLMWVEEEAEDSNG